MIQTVTGDTKYRSFLLKNTKSLTGKHGSQLQFWQNLQHWREI